jgi:hypothetical protein
MKSIFLFVSFIFSQSLFAYIPEYALITSRAADQHGRGAFQIEKDVTFRRDNESYTVKETWTVLNENNLRVTLEGRGVLSGLVQGTIVFEGSQKTFSDGTSLRNQRLGDDWLEPLLHFRSSKYLRSRLVNLKVTPPESLRDRGPLNSEGPPKYEPLSFVRLSRSGGTVNWAIGISPTVGSGPTLWIEQDQFVVRKFKGASGVVMKADNYAKFDDGLWFPRVISYAFGGFNVTVNVNSVKSLGKLTANDNRFKTSSLSAANALKLPDSDILREFYSRFR